MNENRKGENVCGRAYGQKEDKSKNCGNEERKKQI
jgi:hypothetical protein